MMSMIKISHLFLVLEALSLLLYRSSAVYLGPFQSDVWVHDDGQDTSSALKDHATRFVVAMKLNNAESMHQHFLDVSTPASGSYGKHLSLEEVQKLYGPTVDQKRQVISFFASIPGATVECDQRVVTELDAESLLGDMLHVKATVGALEEALGTKLLWKTHSHKATNKRSLRAVEPITRIPQSVQEHLSFLSLNMPVNHAMPRAAKALRSQAAAAREAGAGVAQTAASSSSTTIGVTSGNEEAIIHFTPTCGDGAVNTASPPCSNLPAAGSEIPVFFAFVSSHANNKTDPFDLNTDPYVFSLAGEEVYCYNTYSLSTCDGTANNNCTCMGKLSPLPKYTQLRVNLTAAYFNSSSGSPGAAVVSSLDGLSSADKIESLGTSDLFALTDVATVNFLSQLYNMPKGLTARHGSNQSVAEFYGEFYSNSDLSAFLALSGLKNASIPDSNVFGDLPNDQSQPGGEAQLDVEYIMGMAPGADTFFYSFSNLNPYDEENEGFLAWATFVNSEPYPPLVHSLSYGDNEATVFNVSNNASVEYGERCDQEFMKMGLRGLTVLFSSGDDGIGSYLIRTDPDTACAQAYPEWPAASPYVTAVGATQMTNNYLPICSKPYAMRTAGGYISASTGVPPTAQLTAQCSPETAETVCTSTFGGIITSGGGFSWVSNRTESAPWQVAAVAEYLSPKNQAAYPSPAGYFNTEGRGYPDISTYGSNYFVYLDGEITRESGTSASAPVFAAMVTLWNDLRLAYGMPPMGFIAPFLYAAYQQAPEAFNDITTGNNACGVGYSLETAPCCTESFAASPGWDAVTGLGSPNFELLSALVLNSDTFSPAAGAFPDGTAPFDPAEYDYATQSESNDAQDSADRALEVANAGLSIAVIAFVLAALFGLYVWKLSAAVSSKANAGSGDSISNPLNG